MIYCKHCIHWVDESLDQIEADHGAHSHLFMGCRIFGTTQPNDKRQNCKFYRASRDVFVICSSCRLTVPKLCVSLGECANCTDTDLFCVDSCIGGENRKYCSHFVRLHTEGAHLIHQDRVFDLFPDIGMPARPDEGPARSKETPEKDSSRKAESLHENRSRRKKKP
jgi:hypothetical protein